MQNTYTTHRLMLNRLCPNDNAFIFELLNSEGWKQFIGERNIHTIEDADSYIEKITNNPNVVYWVVQLLDTNIRVGLITLIKRDYLEHHDIGFAFLPQYAKNGYAFEATQTVMDDLLADGNHHTLLAITLPDNAPSINLLEKLGLTFVKEFENEREQLGLYAIHAA